MGKYQVVEKGKKRFLFFHCNRNNVWHEWHELGSLLSPFAASISFFHHSVCKRFVQTKQIYVYWWWVRCVMRECNLCARVPEQDGHKNHAVWSMRIRSSKSCDDTKAKRLKIEKFKLLPAIYGIRRSDDRIHISLFLSPFYLCKYAKLSFKLFK